MISRVIVTLKQLCKPQISRQPACTQAPRQISDACQPQVQWRLCYFWVAVLCVLLKSVSEPMHSFLQAFDTLFQLLETIFVFGVTVLVLVIVCLSHDLNLLLGKSKFRIARCKCIPIITKDGNECRAGRRA